ncbi:hypothetical protein EDE05_106125 [Neorhizobium sp. R1-B]|nr:hypothetical protein EDE05_106125 [Neorhizobium sp. R1-B]
MILALIPDVIKLPAAAILGAALMFFPARWIGQSEGKQMAATASLANSVQILRERNTIDEEVTASDAAALCGSYGLSDDEQAECVRRVQEADAIAGDNDSDPAQGPAVCGPGREPQ